MSALKFRLPPNDGPVLSVVDMHTGGEPLRIVLSGAPVPEGSTVLEKRRWLRENMDWVRRLLMLEPRGHRDMYGALLVPSEVPEAHLGVLFMHNEGYSTMCGHAVIALGRFAVDYGLVEPQGRDTPVNIHCPCGVVQAYVSHNEGRSGRVRFHSVPAFALCTGNCYHHIGIIIMIMSSAPIYVITSPPALLHHITLCTVCYRIILRPGDPWLLVLPLYPLCRSDLFFYFLFYFIFNYIWQTGIRPSSLVMWPSLPVLQLECGRTLSRYLQLSPSTHAPCKVKQSRLHWEAR